MTRSFMISFLISGVLLTLASCNFSGNNPDEKQSSPVKRKVNPKINPKDSAEKQAAIQLQKEQDDQYIRQLPGIYISKIDLITQKEVQLKSTFKADKTMKLEITYYGDLIGLDDNNKGEKNSFDFEGKWNIENGNLIQSKDDVDADDEVYNSILMSLLRTNGKIVRLTPKELAIIDQVSDQEITYIRQKK